MKKALILVGLVIAVVAGLVVAYTAMRKERDLEATAEAPVTAPSRVERSADGAPRVRVDAETQRRLGLQTALLTVGSVAVELTATARVLEIAALAATLSEMRSAQTALDAARTDYDRKKKLFDNGQNASASTVEQAAALVAQHTLSVEAARDRIAAAWGQGMAARTDLTEFARLLLQREAALLRVELLPTDSLASPPQTVQLFRQSGEPIGPARILGPAPTTDSTIAGRSFLCLATSNAVELVPGSALLARLDTGARATGTVIPHTAVIRHTGLGWVYVQTPADTFTRRAVPLDRPHPAGWLVTGEWTQPVIVAGAQSLLSEELKGSIQLKD